MRVSVSKTVLWAAIVAVSGFTLGYAGEAAAIDRQPAVSGVGSSGSRGYGAERPGYGAEREYYGASNLRSAADVRGFRERNRYRAYGSVIEFDDRSDGFDGPYSSEPEGGSLAGVYPGYGARFDGSFVEFGDDGRDTGGRTEQPYPSGPKVIDVESARLDRFRAPKGSVSISYVGSAKIIRIGSGIGEWERPETKPALAPWSDAWKRYCSRAYPDFDPELGVYTAKDGSSRFCTGG